MSGKKGKERLYMAVPNSLKNLWYSNCATYLSICKDNTEIETYRNTLLAVPTTARILLCLDSL